MLEALTVLAFWKKDRRKEQQPVSVERRKMTPKRAQQQLLQSVDRLTEAINKRCGHTR